MPGFDEIVGLADSCARSRIQPPSDTLKFLPLPKPIAGDVKGKLDTFAFETITWSPEEIRQNAEAKSKVYAELVKRKNISLD